MYGVVESDVVMRLIAPADDVHRYAITRSGEPVGYADALNLWQRDEAFRDRELEASGATVALISPQPLSEHRKLVKKFDIPLLFLRDPDNKAAKQLGILAPWGTPMGMQLLGYASDTVLPTVIICDAHGTILYSDLTDNYRIRPEPTEFLQVLRNTSV